MAEKRMLGKVTRVFGKDFVILGENGKEYFATQFWLDDGESNIGKKVGFGKMVTFETRPCEGKPRDMAIRVHKVGSGDRHGMIRRMKHVKGLIAKNYPSGDERTAIMKEIDDLIEYISLLPSVCMNCGETVKRFDFGPDNKFGKRKVEEDDEV